MTSELVRRAQGGDHEAFEVLATGAYNRLYAIAYRILRDAGTAQDAVQEALVRAWRDLRGLRDPERFDAWLYRLIVNSCRDQQRQQKRWRVHTEATDLNASHSGDELAALLDRNELEAAFLGLSVERRAVLVLHYYGGLSAQEVGEALGIPTGTVYSRLHYGTRQLRELLGSAR